MRNLKRALSLGLTAAMISGLMVMGSSAASYADVTSEDNQEAIEVLEAVGIMIGDENGNFNPDQNVTRNEMAVVMSNLMEYNVASYKNTSPFTDVPSWAEPYVAACWTNGITAGYSDTIYGGSDTVTTAQAALMLMKALGYFQYASDFGSDWQLATTRQGNAIDLFDGVDSGVTQAMTRNDVAQLVLNTLEAGTVTASTDGSWSIGDVTIVNNVTYNYVTSNSSYAESIHSVKSTSNTSDADRYVVELGEQLYQGDLRLREGTTDDFGRPSRTWSYENSEIGTYAETPDLTYTAKVEAGDIYKDLGLGANINKSDVTVFVNGLEDEDLALSIRKGSDDTVANSTNGVLTEVYYDEEADTVLIVRVDTYVGTVVKTVDATDKRDAYVVINPEDVNPGIGNEEFETDEEFADEAYVLYTYSEAVDEIKSVQLAEEVSGEVTRAENSDTNNADKKALTIDGTRYAASANISGENLGDVSVNEQYTVYLDAYGYLIYVERIDEIGDYALLYQTSLGGVFNSNKAFLVFADGTTGVVNTAKHYDDEDALNVDQNGDGDMNDSITAPIIVTYREDEDGVYTLRGVSSKQSNGSVNVTMTAPNETDFSLVNDKAGITGLPQGTVTANSATTFVVRDPDDRTDPEVYDWTAYTGIKNAPTIEIKDLDAVGEPGHGTVDRDEQANVYYYCKTGKMVTIMFIVPDKQVIVDDGNNSALYLSQESVSNLIHDADGDYYEYAAVVNGETTTMKVSSDVTVDGSKVGEAAAKNLGDMIYTRYSTDKNGIITRLTKYGTYTDGDESGMAFGKGIDKVSKEYTVIINTKGVGSSYTITVDEDADIFYVNEDGKISASSYNGIAIDDDDMVYAVVDDYMVQTLVIVEKNDKNNAQPAGVSITGEKNVTIGDELVLTANVTLASKNDEVIGYQWYRTTAPANYGTVVADIEANATKIVGATSATLTVDTATAGSYYYYCVVETYNDKVPGVDTAKAADMSAQITISNPADPEMTIRVYYRLSDDTIIFSEVLSNQTAETNGYVTVKAEMYKNSALHAYELVGTDTDYVAMVPNGTANVYFTVEAGTPANAGTAVTNASGEWGTVDGGGNYTATGNWNASGNTVSADYNPADLANLENVMNDTARFLGSLYRNGNANVIVFNGVTYKWDSSEPLKGSNWFNAEDDALNDAEGSKNTLVSALVTWQAANPTATSLTLTVDGVNITINYDFT